MSTVPAWQHTGMASLDALPDWDKVSHTPVWDSTERPPDPVAYVVRCVMRDYLSEAHRTALEMHYFEGRSITEIAHIRGATRPPTSRLIKRAEKRLKEMLIEHAEEYQEVPSEEL